MSVGFGGFAVNICLAYCLIPGAFQGSWWAFSICWREGWVAISPHQVLWELVCLMEQSVEPADTSWNRFPDQGYCLQGSMNAQSFGGAHLWATPLGWKIKWPLPIQDGWVSGPGPQDGPHFALSTATRFSHRVTDTQSWMSPSGGDFLWGLTFVSAFSASAWWPWGGPLFLRGALCVLGGLDYHCRSQAICPVSPLDGIFLWSGSLLLQCYGVREPHWVVQGHRKWSGPYEFLSGRFCL